VDCNGHETLESGSTAAAANPKSGVTKLSKHRLGTSKDAAASYQSWMQPDQDDWWASPVSSADPATCQGQLAHVGKQKGFSPADGAATWPSLNRTGGRVASRPSRHGYMSCISRPFGACFDS
jgi:hypothetical protein